MPRFFRPRFASPIFRSRGTVLLELVVSSLILVAVIMAIGTFFIGHLRAFDRGKEQMELQRMGTIVMEGMACAVREGSRVEGNIVGETITAIQIYYPGEPFFDANHNGTWDTGEDFIDIYQRAPDGSTTGFQGVWNSASGGPGDTAMPTVYFGLDDSGPDGGIIRTGTDQSDSLPWDILVSDATRGSIWFDDLAFDISPGGQSVGIAFTIRNDLGTGDLNDDIFMDFSSSVNLRE